ncbi:Hypothetical_protein [Hexamita inflata]|uniref:Hypothetical_protein n=1 Tax=Hexamita inflata TaxID=28002 RepID=A0AA86TXZ8_9EUKA|nr:Hypothetical protein HINF_LOCUS20759 [Hexamita inflata]
MGRPYNIDANQFTQALANYFQTANNKSFDSDNSLFEAFTKVYKINRTKIWNHVAQLLGKSTNQVRNYYFNSWMKLFQNESESVNNISKDSSQKSKKQIDLEYLDVQKYPLRPMLLNFNDFKVDTGLFPSPRAQGSFIISFMQ